MKPIEPMQEPEGLLWQLETLYPAVPLTRWQRAKNWFKKDPFDNSMKLGLTVVVAIIVVYGLNIGIEQYGWFGG